MMKINEPVVMAMPDTRWINCWISRDMGVGPESTPEVSVAMRPITVLSPMLTTIPLARPVVNKTFDLNR